MLVLAVAALGGGAVYVRRSKLAVGNVTAGNRLRVMSSVRVGPKGYLVLAGVGERAILLGVTDDSVRRIAWMDSEVSPTPALPVAAEPSPPMQGSRAEAATPPFRDFLRGLRASAGSATKELQISGPADEVAAEKEDVVQWSAGVTANKPTRRGLPPVEPSPASASSATASSLEQQAAGIARRKARRPT
jgi:flagellar biogenesis protein FliO